MSSHFIFKLGAPLLFASIATLFLPLILNFFKKRSQPIFKIISEENFFPAIWIFALAWLFDILKSAYYPESKLLPFNLVPLAFFALIGFYFQRIKDKYTNFLITKSQKGELNFPSPKIDGLSKLISLLFFLVLSLFILDSLGYSGATLLTLGGVSGLFFGFALKDFAANFFGGLAIYLTKPFSIGDEIIIHQKGIRGKVKDIGWYLTRLIDEEKQPVHVPNALFSEAIIITPSHRSHRLIKETLFIPQIYLSKVKQITENITLRLQTLDNLDPHLRRDAYFAGCDGSSCKIEIFGFTKPLSLQDFYKQKLELVQIALDEIDKMGAKISESKLLVSLDPPFNFSQKTGSND